MKHVLLYVVSLFFVVECFAAGEIDLAQDAYIGRLKPALGENVDLYRVHGGADPSIRHRFYTTRAVLKIPPGVAPGPGTPKFTDDDQRILRNEICASAKLRTQGPQMDIGYVGLYKRFNTIYGIADNAFAGQPLTKVLRELATRPTQDKDDYATYYAANMLVILELLDSNDVIWNNFDLEHFYVKPNGRLFAFDLSEATSSADPATLNQEKQEQRNNFINETLRNMLALLFPNLSEAHSKFNNIVSVHAGLVAETARFHNWAIIPDLRNVITFNAGIRWQANLGFELDAITYLQNLAHRPYVPDSGSLMGSAIPPSWQNIEATNFPSNGLQTTGATNRAANNVGIEQAVRLLTNRGDGTPYVGFAAMCNNWTGE